jgi:hypothetical protein
MESNPLYINTMNNIASAYFFMLDYDRALEIDKQIVEITNTNLLSII